MSGGTEEGEGGWRVADDGVNEVKVSVGAAGKAATDIYCCYVLRKRTPQLERLATVASAWLRVRLTWIAAVVRRPSCRASREPQCAAVRRMAGWMVAAERLRPTLSSADKGTHERPLEAVSLLAARPVHRGERSRHRRCPMLIRLYRYTVTRRSLDAGITYNITVNAAACLTC